MRSRMIAVVLALACAALGLGGGVDLMNQAEAEAKAGNHDAALRTYTEAVKATDLSKAQLAHAYYKRGGVYGYLGENIKGIADYSKSLELNPNFGYALSLRGYLRGTIGQYDLAEKDQKAALALAPSMNSPTYQPWVLQHYADIWRRRGQYDKALDLRPGPQAQRVSVGVFPPGLDLPRHEPTGRRQGRIQEIRGGDDQAGHSLFDPVARRARRGRTPGPAALRWLTPHRPSARA